MKIVNRGFLIVKAKQPFFDWANQFEDDVYFSEEDNVEPSIYLVEDDFMEGEPLIQQNFKQVFKTELSMVTEDESEFPPITEENFLSFFEITLGTTVFDTQKEDLNRFELD